MVSQSNIFNKSEGNAWFERNKQALLTKNSDNDMLLGEMKKIYSSLQGVRYLEIGCSNGFRLAWVKEFGGNVCGIEPGKMAVEHGKESFSLTEEEIIATDASAFFDTNEAKFDIISFAHCLYLIPPHEIPSIISGAVKALVDGGVIIIYDFDSKPQSQKYHHLEGVCSYKADFAQYFTWLPYMHLIKKLVVNHGDGTISDGDQTQDCALSIIKKIALEKAYPELQK